MTDAHPSALVASDTLLGEGTQVGPFAVVGIDGDGPATELGSGAVLRSHTVLYRGVRAGRGLATGHGTLIREGTTLGDHVSIGSHSVLEHHVTVGDGVRIHSSCFVPEFTVLEDGAWLGPGVRITNARYPNRPDTKANLEGVTVARGAVIGAAAVLLPGIRIGEGALVGAGAVVVHDVPDGAVVVGNPARTVDRAADPSGGPA
jgi:acetyltransferase-like isoleucine patch superfamily enzyme